MATKTKNKVRARKAKPVIAAVHVRGLQGKGLLKIGKEARLELRDRLQMPRVLFGRIVNVSERTIAKVEAQAETAAKLRRPYNEVYRLYEALSEVVDPACLGNWFDTPHVAFDGLKPMEILERGEIDRLWDMVFRLRSGMPD
jgi:hypothetical protein